MYQLDQQETERAWRVDAIIIIGATIVHPAIGVAARLIDNFGEPWFARLSTLIVGLIFLTLLWTKEETRKYSQPMWLSIAAIVTFEFYYLVYRFAYLGEFRTFFIYTNGAFVVITLFLSCARSRASIYIYTATVSLAVTGAFLSIFILHPEFSKQVNALNSYLHQLVAIGIGFTVAWQKSRLEGHLKDKILETQKLMLINGKMAGLGVMASGIADEINSPLNSISASAKSLKNELTSGVPDAKKMTKFAESIEVTAAKVAEIVSGLLRVSRAGGGEDVVPDSINVSRVVREVVEISKARLSDAGITVNIQLPHLLLVPADKVQLEEVFINLINNAIDAIEMLDDETGSVKRVIRIYARRGSQFEEICIEDTGVPIAEEIRDKVFDPFYTTKPIGMGTGLGLSVSRAIAVAHGGNIVIEHHPKAVVLSLPTAAVGAVESRLSIKGAA